MLQDLILSHTKSITQHQINAAQLYANYVETYNAVNSGNATMAELYTVIRDMGYEQYQAYALARELFTISSALYFPVMEYETICVQIPDAGIFYLTVDPSIIMLFKDVRNNSEDTIQGLSYGHLPIGTVIHCANGVFVNQ